MFKMGDKVRILGKSIGMSLGETSLVVGDIVRIREVYRTWIVTCPLLSNKVYHFSYNDLEEGEQQLKLWKD